MAGATASEISNLLDEKAEAAGATRRMGDDEVGYEGYATRTQVSDFVQREKRSVTKGEQTNKHLSDNDHR